MEAASSECTKASGVHVLTNVQQHNKPSLMRGWLAFCRFHAQRFYALHCLATREANATAIKADMSLNMMAIEMPVAKAADFYQHVQVKSCSDSMNQQSPSPLSASIYKAHIAYCICGTHVQETLACPAVL